MANRSLESLQVGLHSSFSCFDKDMTACGTSPDPNIAKASLIVSTYSRMPRLGFARELLDSMAATHLHHGTWSFKLSEACHDSIWTVDGLRVCSFKPRCWGSGVWSCCFKRKNMGLRVWGHELSSPNHSNSAPASWHRSGTCTCTRVHMHTQSCMLSPVVQKAPELLMPPRSSVASLLEVR